MYLALRNYFFYIGQSSASSGVANATIRKTTAMNRSIRQEKDFTPRPYHAFPLFTPARFRANLKK